MPPAFSTNTVASAFSPSASEMRDSRLAASDVSPAITQVSFAPSATFTRVTWFNRFVRSPEPCVSTNEASAPSPTWTNSRDEAMCPSGPENTCAIRIASGFAPASTSISTPSVAKAAFSPSTVSSCDQSAASGSPSSPCVSVTPAGSAAERSGMNQPSAKASEAPSKRSRTSSTCGFAEGRNPSRSRARRSV